MEKILCIAKVVILFGQNGFDVCQLRLNPSDARSVSYHFIDLFELLTELPADRLLCFVSSDWTNQLGRQFRLTDIDLLLHRL